MSLPPSSFDALIPEETVRVARAAFPRGSLAVSLRDVLGAIYHDGMFADLYPAEGQPAYSPWRLALVTVLQYAEHLTDEQAALAVRGRIDWKYALGLSLTDPGFDASVLSEFRDRLVAGGAEERLLWAVLELCLERKLLTERGRVRTDSTHVLAAVRHLNRVELVGEMLRVTLEALAVAAPDWVRAHIPGEWVERYGRRIEEYRLPTSEIARRELAETIGQDGTTVLTALQQADAPAWLAQLPAVQRLKRVWSQQYEQRGTALRFRATAALPPASELVVSPHDEDARWGKKRQMGWEGYKAHVTETCEAAQPALIIQVETTAAPVPDQHVLPASWDDLERRDLLPGEQIVDTGYTDAPNLVEAQAKGIRLLGPVQEDTSWQARAGQGYALDAFVVDWEQERVQCPAGATSQVWSRTTNSRGNAVIRVRFAGADCQACSAKALCTRSPGARSLTLLPTQELATARTDALARQQTTAFREAYRQRAGIEGTISQSVRRTGLRQARYRGIEKVHLEHCAEAAAVDCIRLAAWYENTPRARIRRSHLTRVLAPAA